MIQNTSRTVILVEAAPLQRAPLWLQRRTSCAYVPVCVLVCLYLRVLVNLSARRRRSSRSRRGGRPPR